MTVAVYLDTDTDGNDLLDSSGANITAGWYTYNWPLGSDPIDGPHALQEDCGKDEKEF